MKSDFQFVLDYLFYKAFRKLDNLTLSGNNCLVEAVAVFTEAQDEIKEQQGSEFRDI